MNTLLLWLAAGVLRSQWGRFAAATMSVAIGVALALAIHLVNRSALEEFSAAMGTIQGEASLQVRARQGSLSDDAFEILSLDPAVAEASAVIDTELALQGPLNSEPQAHQRKSRIRLIGLDPLRAAAINPALLPRDGHGRLFDREAIFLSEFTARTLGLQSGSVLRLAGQDLRVAGLFSPSPDNSLQATMDIGAAQWLLRDAGYMGKISRVDVKLRPGQSPAAFKKNIELKQPLWMAAAPGDSVQKMSNLSRAYRVNLNVLAMVALVSGAFMVYATMSLAVRRQARQQALLGILGAPQQLGQRVALSQGLLIGLAGSLLGLLLGVALAWGVLQWVGGDLGGGYFAGSRPPLQVDAPALLGFFAIGLVISLMGCIVPARQLGRILPAEAIRYGLDRPLPATPARHTLAWIAAAVVLIAVLSVAPAWNGIPVAAYLAIGLMVLAGVMLVPVWIRLASRWLARHPFFAAQHTGYWLASQKLSRMPGQASAAVAGIVASLALASAMAIMVHSFRNSVDQWLLTLLPADLYVRPEGQDSPGNAAIWSRQQMDLIRATPGVQRVEGLRVLELNLSETLAPVALLAKDLSPDQPSKSLPFAGPEPSAAQLDAIVRAGRVPVFASEAMVDLYGWKSGDVVRLPLAAMTREGKIFEIAGVWRDYVRQQGSVVIDRRQYQALTGDLSVNDVLLWLEPAAAAEQVSGKLRQRMAPQALSIRSTQEIRALSLAMFDRSFALTYVLEAVAIIGALFGVASTYSGEALARAREFGMLRHLGVTRRQVSRLFAIETTLMLVFAVLWSLVLSLGIAWILIQRVNPQSFHWTMDTSIPWLSLVLSGLIVLCLGVITAWFATRSATRHGPILAVREDW